MSNILDSDIKYLPGIGPKRAELLGKELNIRTFRDLLYFFPFRYIDRSRIYAIAEIIPSMAYIQIRGKIIRMETMGENPRNKRLVVKIQDATGVLDLVFFKGIKWIQEKIKTGQEYIVFGKPASFNGTVNMVHPEINPVTEEILYGGSSMMGVYSSTERLKNSGIGNKVFSKFQLSLLEKYIEAVPESLPAYIIERKGLCPIRHALKNIHFPTDAQALAEASLLFSRNKL